MKTIPQYRIARVSAKVIFFIGAMFFALSILVLLIKITEESISSDSLFFLGVAFNALLLIVASQLSLSVLDNAEHKARMLALMQEIYHIDVEREYASSVFFSLVRKFFINLINLTATIIRPIISLIFILIMLVGILYYIPEFYQKKEIMWLIVWVTLVVILTVIPEKLDNKVKWQQTLSKYRLFSKYYWWVRLGVATIAVTTVFFSYEFIHTTVQIPENITVDSDLKKIYEDTWGKEYESYGIYPFYVSLTYKLTHNYYNNEQVTKKIEFYDPIITRDFIGTTISWKFKLGNKEYKFPSFDDNSTDMDRLYFIKYEEIKVSAGKFKCIVAKIKGIKNLTVWMIIDKPGIYAKAIDGRTIYELDSIRRKTDFIINSFFKIMNEIYKISKWIKSHF